MFLPLVEGRGRRITWRYLTFVVKLVVFVQCLSFTVSLLSQQIPHLPRVTVPGHMEFAWCPALSPPTSRGVALAYHAPFCRCASWSPVFDEPSLLASSEPSRPFYESATGFTAGKFGFTASRVEPLLYAALQISSADDPLLSALRSKPLTFRQHAVRHLFLHHRLNGSTKEVNEEVLCACPGIINLVIDRGLDLDLLPVLDKLRLQRIDLSVPPLGSQWASSILKHRLFLSITHLSFFQNHDADPEPSKWEDWSQLAALPALTHLSLSEDISAIFPSALDECRGLVLAVTLFWTRPLRTRAVTFAQRLAVADARFLVMVTANAVETEWEIGAWGGDDYWARAERFIARRRAGEIEATCYFLDETADQMSQLLRVSRISI